MIINIKNKDFPLFFVKQFVPFVSLSRLKKMKCFPPKGYLWMVCDYDLVKCYKGDQAMLAYDNADKSDAIEIQYDNGFFDDDISRPLSISNDTAKKINDSKIIEFYVIGKECSWCYIVTHEYNGCGPFFIRNETCDSEDEKTDT